MNILNRNLIAHSAVCIDSDMAFDDNYKDFYDSIIDNFRRLIQDHIFVDNALSLDHSYTLSRELYNGDIKKYLTNLELFLLDASAYSNNIERAYNIYKSHDDDRPLVVVNSFRSLYKFYRLNEYDKKDNDGSFHYFDFINDFMNISYNDTTPYLHFNSSIYLASKSSYENKCIADLEIDNRKAILFDISKLLTDSYQSSDELTDKIANKMIEVMNNPYTDSVYAV